MLRLFSTLMIFFIINLVRMATIKDLSSCICDVTDTCDNQCCCDTNCGNNYKLAWLQQSLCVDDSLSIPLCSSVDKSPTLNDLYSGLRTIYIVIRRVFCISTINILSPTASFIVSPSQSTIATLTSSNAEISAIDPRISVLANTQYANLPLKNTQGLCQASTLKTLYQVNYQTCKTIVQDIGTIETHPFLSIQAWKSLFSGIIVRQGKNNGQFNSTQSPSIRTNCLGTICSNVVKFAKLVFISTNQSATATISLQNSYIVVETVNVPINNFYTKFGYSYEFIQTNTAILPSRQVGYSIGDPLQLLLESTPASGTTGSLYYRIYNPIHLAYLKSDGTCRTLSTDEDASQQIYLKFGENIVLSCIGDTSLISINLIQIFNRIGIRGNPKQLGDYMAINIPTDAASKSLQLLISYTKIGEQVNPQYQITQIDANSLTIVSRQITLFIQFQEISNPASLYIPSPPTPDAYLPNDFLYPFFIA